MKIGILTFHRAENMGAVLQAYALQTYLTRIGQDVFIINYRPKSIERTYHILNPYILFHEKNIVLSLRAYLKRFLTIYSRYRKKYLYKNFRKKYFHETNPMLTIEKPLNFDAYIVGSDQVWNMKLTKGMDDFFFLNFPVKSGALKVSYAASSEYFSYDCIFQNKKRVKNLLEKFNSISVREKSLQEVIERITQKQISLCVDPTFLLSKEDYYKIAIRPKVKSYVLVYHMQEDSRSVDLAERIAKSKNIDVIEIHADFYRSTNRKRHKIGLGPLELLGYIAYADSVITTSFHGMALSIILQKNFWSFITSSSTRQLNLLEALDLRSRMLENLYSFVSHDIDYSIVNRKIRLLIENSESFLQKSLNL